MSTQLLQVVCFSVSCGCELRQTRQLMFSSLLWCWFLCLWGMLSIYSHAEEICQLPPSCQHGRATWILSGKTQRRQGTQVTFVAWQSRLNFKPNTASGGRTRFAMEEKQNLGRWANQALVNCGDSMFPLIHWFNWGWDPLSGCNLDL